ncbi:TIR-like protein FxsC [Phytohabitans houttuyneae]|uniref:TIR-like protein FxsC n=1 Tax=Phytohabitans houttuyneae TaxID=1076126 RepID=UPI0015640155|nr:TIR-like protein FxsC [Phytohabitans houttuyneae]
MIDKEPDVDRPAPLFFVSYAHTRSSHLIGTFFEDLSGHVQELIGRIPGDDPGFLDRSMAGGRRWAPELLRAVATCQVFIPLLSASLFESAWCGYEWYAFSRRQVLNRRSGRPDMETAIVPVIWVPHGTKSEPAVVGQIQRFSPSGLPEEVVKKYQLEGIYGLSFVDTNAYRAVVWKLAQRVVGLHLSHYVERAPIPDETQLRNAFTEESG